MVPFSSKSLVLRVVLLLLPCHGLFAQASWHYDTLYPKPVFDCMEIGGSDIVAAVRGGIVNIKRPDSFLVKAPTEFKWFSQLGNETCCFAGNGKIYWFNQTGEIGQTRFTTANGMDLTDVHSISEGRQHYLILAKKASAKRKGAAYVYYVEKKELRSTTAVCALNRADIKNYHGYGKTNDIVLFNGIEYLLCDDGIFQMDAIMETVYDENNNAMQVFKEYNLKKECSKLTKTDIHCAVVSDDANTLHLGGGGLWSYSTKRSCDSVAEQSCHAMPPLGLIEDMIISDGHLWMVSKDKGITSYHLQHGYFEQHQPFGQDSTYHAPKFTLTDHGLVVSGKNGLLKIAPDKKEKAPATIVMIGVNGFLRYPVQKGSSVRMWDIVKQLVSLLCADNMFGQVILNRFPKDGSKYYIPSGPSDLEVFLDELERLITDNQVLVQRTAAREKNWGANLEQLIEALKPTLHNYSEMRIVTITNGKDDILPANTTFISDLHENCGIDISMNVLSSLNGSGKFRREDSLALADLSANAGFLFSNFVVDSTARAEGMARTIFENICHNEELTLKPETQKRMILIREN